MDNPSWWFTASLLLAVAASAGAAVSAWTHASRLSRQNRRVSELANEIEGLRMQLLSHRKWIQKLSGYLVTAAPVRSVANSAPSGSPPEHSTEPAQALSSSELAQWRRDRGVPQNPAAWPAWIRDNMTK